MDLTIILDMEPQVDSEYQASPQEMVHILNKARTLLQIQHWAFMNCLHSLSMVYQVLVTLVVVVFLLTLIFVFLVFYSSSSSFSPCSRQARLDWGGGGGGGQN